MKALSAFFLLLSLCQRVSASEIHYPALSEEGLKNIASVYGRITANCPPSTCIIAFIGGSNVLISAYMEAKGEKNHVNLPATNVRASMNEAELRRVEGNFSQLVLSPLLGPQLEGRRKIVVVDYSNTGSSITRVALWIKNYAKPLGLSEVEVMYYGNFLGEEYRRSLDSAKIKHTFMSAGGSRQPGSLVYLAAESHLSEYAPYEGWNPATENSSPKIDRNRRANYNYLEEDGSKKYSHYASYNELVEAFSLPNPLAIMSKAPSCRAFLGGGDIL